MTQIIMLGSGSCHGVPAPGCECPNCTTIYAGRTKLRTTAAIYLPESKTLFDAGADLGYQMTRWGINKVDRLFLTHSDVDHIAGLYFLECQVTYRKEKKSLPLYGPESCIKDVKRTFPFLFEKGPEKIDMEGRIPTFIEHILKPREEILGNEKITAIHVEHRPYTKTFGYIIEVNEKRIAYIPDIDSFEEDKTIKESKVPYILQGLDLLIIGGAHNGGVGKGHISWKEAINLGKKINSKEIILTHLGHRVNINPKDLPKNTKLGYDGLEILI